MQLWVVFRIYSMLQKVIIGEWNLLPRHTEIRSGWQRIAILALHWKWKNPKKCFLYPVDLQIKIDH